jgi:hypothetical protein
MRSENRNSRLVLLSLMAVFAIGATGAALADGPTNFAEAVAQAAAEDKVLVLDFYTDW